MIVLQRCSVFKPLPSLDRFHTQLFQISAGHERSRDCRAQEAAARNRRLATGYAR
jgi:hypothetical protein